MIVVGVVDSQPLIVDGLSSLFADRNEFDLIATGRSLSDAVDITRQFAPDVLVIEPMLEGNGFDTIARIASSTTTKIVAFTSVFGVEPAVRALDSGARGYALKSDPTEELLRAVAAVHKGDTYIAPMFAAKVIVALRNSVLRKKAAHAIKLSFREETIVEMLLQGLTNREIGTQLSISEKTVKHYMTILMQKLHARNRLEVLIAVQKIGAEKISSSNFGMEARYIN